MDDEATTAEVWEQDGPYGGSYAGADAAYAAPVAVVGLVAVREVPPLLAVASTYQNQSQGAVFHLIGASPQRRRLLISTTVDIVIHTDRGAAQGGNGLLIKANLAPVTITACEDIYVGVVGPGPGNIHAWAEVDPG